MAVANAREFFEKQIPATLADKPDIAEKVNSSYKFTITGDDGGTWVIDLTTPGGKVTEADTDAACSITIASGDFVDLVNGKLDAQMAFMGGKLKVAGDMALAMKLTILIG